jgi:hypothetical protein
MFGGAYKLDSFATDSRAKDTLIFEGEEIVLSVFSIFLGCHRVFKG